MHKKIVYSIHHNFNVYFYAKSLQVHVFLNTSLLVTVVFSYDI